MCWGKTPLSAFAGTDRPLHLVLDTSTKLHDPVLNQPPIFRSHFGLADADICKTLHYGKKVEMYSVVIATYQFLDNWLEKGKVSDPAGSPPPHFY